MKFINYISLTTIVLLITATQLISQDAFVTIWKTDNPGESESNQIEIPTTGGAYLFDVDWGDGSTDVEVEGNISHTYDEPGTYTVTITGVFLQIYFNNGGDKDKLISIEQWGTTTWRSMHNAFKGCSRLKINAKDVPDLSFVEDFSGIFSRTSGLAGNLNDWDVSSVTDMSSAFLFSGFNQNINDWDVSNVTDMSSMFAFAEKFNGDISDWDVSNVTDMSDMFRNTNDFNIDIGGWDVSQVTDMTEMFTAARSFNQDIGQWDVGNVESMDFMFDRTLRFNQNLNDWDVSSVKSMFGMFSYARAFNQDINGWDVSNVENMTSMFEQTTFNQDISIWDVSSVKRMVGMFASTYQFDQNLGNWNMQGVELVDGIFYNSNMSTANYDKTLIGWASQNLQDSLKMDASGMNYCESFTSRQQLIDLFSWEITGDELNCDADLRLTTRTFSENLPEGTVLTEFNVVNPSSESDYQNVTYELVGDPNLYFNDDFMISGNQLIAVNPYDFETGGASRIRLKATVSNDVIVEKDYFLIVSDINEIPIVLGSPLAYELNEFPEVGHELGKVVVEDPENDFILYTISGGTESPFQISSEGVIYIANLNFDRLNYGLVVTVSDGALSSESAVNIELNFPVNSSAENSEQELMVYPNPTTDYLTIRTNELGTSHYQAQVYDLQGNLIMIPDVKSPIDFTSYSKGVYLLRLEYGGKIETYKVIKTE